MENLNRVEWIQILMSWYMPELLTALLEKYNDPKPDDKDKKPKQDDNKDE
jgi:hypothetical protein